MMLPSLNQQRKITLSNLYLRGPVAENPDSTRHYLKDALLFEPYLSQHTVPILEKGHEMDLSRAVLVGGSAFADLVRHRDLHLVRMVPGDPPKERGISLIRIISNPGLPDQELRLQFFLTPLFFGGVFWTFVLTADRPTLRLLEEVFPPTDPTKTYCGPLDGLQT